MATLGESLVQGYDEAVLDDAGQYTSEPLSADLIGRAPHQPGIEAVAQVVEITGSEEPTHLQVDQERLLNFAQLARLRPREVEMLRTVLDTVELDTWFSSSTISIPDGEYLVPTAHQNARLRMIRKLTKDGLFVHNGSPRSASCYRIDSIRVEYYGLMREATDQAEVVSDAFDSQPSPAQSAEITRNGVLLALEAERLVKEKRYYERLCTEDLVIKRILSEEPIGRLDHDLLDLHRAYTEIAAASPEIRTPQVVDNLTKVFTYLRDSLVDVSDFRSFANCLGVGSELFFPEQGASAKDAKVVCQGCVVREQCLEYALVNGEKFGIWGGLGERERRRIRRQQAPRTA